MNSRDYWAKRSALDMVEYMRSAEQTAALMEKAGKTAAAYITKQTKGIFSAFKSFGISESEARRVLSAANDKTALQALRAAAAKIKDETARNALTEAINSAGAYRYRIDRLEEVSRQITQTCNSLYKTQLAQTTSCLSGVASSAYYHTIFNLQQQTGLAFSFAQFPQEQVERLLKTHWTGDSYSQRIWNNTNALAGRLKDELLIGLMSGRSDAKTARVIQEAFQSNSFCARRLVRTESAYVANAAVGKGYDEAGIERYIFVATLDAKTSEVCAELDGKSFDRKDAKPGTNYPPMHPWCRSTTIADFGKDTLKGLERRAKDENGNTVKVPASQSYEEWYKQNVSEKERLPLDNSQESGIIEIERAMAAKTFDKAAEYAKKELGASISSLSELPLKTVNAVNRSIGKLYQDVPSLSGIIDEIVVDDIDEIAKSALGWVNGSPRIRLKLSRSYFANMSVDELEEAISNLAKAGVFTPKKGINGIIQHEAVHLAEFQQTIKRYGGYQNAIEQSLDSFELARELKELALRNCSLDDTSITVNSMLCSYAEVSPAEFLAEGYSSTNSNPLTEEIKRLLRKKWGM